MTDLETQADRASWDLTWMRMARVIARRSLCDGEKVGAVIASQQDRVVAVGYNNPPRGFDHQGRSCLAWCNRMQDSRKITGFEQDEKLMWTAPNQLTEWGSRADDGSYLEVNGWRRFTIKDTDEETLTEVMQSCGFKPVRSKPRESYDDCPSLHAEANALSVCDRSQRSYGTIYVTSIPCMTCAKLIANSGLARVVYRETRQGVDRESRGDESPLAFLAECGIVVRQL